MRPVRSNLSCFEALKALGAGWFRRSPAGRWIQALGGMGRRAARVGRGLLAVAGGLALAAAAEPPAAASLPVPEVFFPDLAEALREGVTGAPRLLRQRLAIEQAEGHARMARAGRLPRVEGVYQYNLQRDKRIDIVGYATSAKNYYRLDFTQPLYQWNALKHRDRIGQLQLEMAHNDTEQVRQAFVFELRDVYLRLILQTAALRNARYALAQAEKALARLQTQIKEGTSASGELFGQELGVDEGRLHVARQEEDLEQVRRQYRRLTGVEAPSPERLPAEVPAPGPPDEVVAAWLQQFLATETLPSPRWENVQHQVQIEDLNYRIAQVRLRPKLNLVAGINQDEVNYTSNVANRSMLQTEFVGLQLNWTLFDGLAARGEKQIALARKRTAEQNKIELEDELRDRARHLARQVDFAAKAMELTDRRAQADETGYAITKENIELGLASANELESAQGRRDDSRLVVSRARAEYLLRVAEFLNHIGRDPAMDLPANPQP